MNPLYPPCALFDWPDLADWSPDRAEKTLLSLGFERVFLDTYVDLGSRLEAQAKRLADRKSRKERLDSAYVPRNEMMSQAWVHPSGLWVAMEGYRPLGTEAEWAFNWIHCEARINKGYPQADDRFRGSPGADGQWVAPLVLRIGPDGNLPEQWSTIQEAALAGRLVPFFAWEDPPEGFPMERPAMACLEANPRRELKIPMERYRYSQKLYHRSSAKIMAYWKRKLQEAPDRPGEGASRENPACRDRSLKMLEWVKEKLVAASQAWSAASGSPAGDRKMLARMRHEAAAAQLARLLGASGILEATPHLEEKERRQMAAWLAALTTAGAWPARLVSALQGERGRFPRARVEFVEILLSLPDLDGTAERATGFIRGLSDGTLRRMCQEPGVDGDTLPMRLARFWMETNIVKPKTERLERNAAAAVELLDFLIHRLGSSALVWESPHRNVWESALGRRINTFADQDLMVIHQKKVESFVEWVRKAAIPDFPFHVRTLFKHDQVTLRALGWSENPWWSETPQGVVFDVPLEKERFVEGWTCGTAHEKEEALARWGFLKAVGALGRSLKLDQALQDVPLEPPAPASGKLRF